MKKYTWPFIVLATLAGVSAADAGFEEPPVIVVNSAERRITAYVEADENSDLNEIVDDTISGPFVDAIPNVIGGSEGSLADGFAEQDTRITTFSIQGSGSVFADASLGVGEKASVSVASDSRIFVNFNVPEGAAYTLSGSLKVDGEAGGFCLSGATVSLSLIHNHSVDCNTVLEDEDFFFVGVALDSNMAIAVEVNTFPEGGGPVDLQGEGTASFEFTLDFGDRDADGLFDSWEENGIDFSGPGIEIDLPGMGANPDKKDLFVEVDVMDGVEFDPAAMVAVEAAFAQAPASMVDNPDDTLGIQLHIVVDGDRPAHSPMVVSAGERLPAQFYAIKESYFGSESQRAHPSAAEIRVARLLIYRYCLWADTLNRPGAVLYGRAEAIPANDFIVAGGTIAVDYFPLTVFENQASVFMHELGHALGLHHGGQNDENYKPNYLSIMNYSYIAKIPVITAQGTDVSDAWRLDYSRSTMRPLDETKLFEMPGLFGPSGRLVRFNGAAETDPTPVVRVQSWANRPYINWNRNEDRDEGPYAQDITRLREAAPPHYDATLESFTDWDRIWYHIGGTPDFDDRQALPYADVSPGLERDAIIAFHDVEWIDLTALDDVVFANDFELGSTTAWSDTVP